MTSIKTRVALAIILIVVIAAAAADNTHRVALFVWLAVLVLGSTGGTPKPPTDSTLT